MVSITLQTCCEDIHVQTCEQLCLIILSLEIFTHVYNNTPAKFIHCGLLSSNTLSPSPPTKSP